MRRILVRKCNDIPFISFFHIPHSCSPRAYFPILRSTHQIRRAVIGISILSPQWQAAVSHLDLSLRAYSSFHSNTVKGKVGENNNFEGLDVHQGMSEVGRIGYAKKIYAEMVSVGLMPNYIQGTLPNGNTLWKKYLFDKADASCNRINEMATVMKEMAGRGFSFDATKAILLANVIRESPSFLDMIVEKSRRELTHAARGIEKEISALQSEEKKLVAEIKRTAKTNKTATKDLARQFLRLRRQITILRGSRAQMEGIATHMQQMDPAKQAKVMQDFPRQSAQLDMTTEMMSDSIDDDIDNGEVKEEIEDLTNQILDEIGVDVASQLSVAPKGKIAGKRTEELSSSEIDELEKCWLTALRNS